MHNLVAGQVGKGGLAQPIGDAFSKEGFNRFERKGKDDKGNYVPGAAGQLANPVVDAGKTAGTSAYSGGMAAVGKVGEGTSAAGSYVGGILGRKKQPESN